MRQHNYWRHQRKQQYNEADCPIIKIEITGNVESIETESGDVRCNAVSGNVNTMSGDVTCDNIKGHCSTMSGDIRR